MSCICGYDDCRCGCKGDPFKCSCDEVAESADLGVPSEWASYATDPEYDQEDDSQEIFEVLKERRNPICKGCGLEDCECQSVGYCVCDKRRNPDPDGNPWGPSLYNPYEDDHHEFKDDSVYRNMISRFRRNPCSCGDPECPDCWPE